MTFKAFQSRAATSRGAASLPAGSAAIVVALTYAIARLVFQKIPLGVAVVWLLAGSGLRPAPSLAGPLEGVAA